MLNILIAHDGSECANAAIDDLGRAGLPAETHVVVLSVADVWPHLAQETYEILSADQLSMLPLTLRRAHILARRGLDDAKGIAKSAAERLGRLFPAWKIETAARGDTPYQGILKHAEQMKADLIVVGSHGRSALGRLALGSVSHKVVTHAHCSVRITHPRKSPASGPVRLIVAIDGSANAQAAVDAIAGRRWPKDTLATAIAVLDTQISTVIPTFDMPISAGQPTPTDERERMQQTVEQAARQLESAGLDAVALVRDGDPRQVLLAEAEATGADCIFVGARGMSNLERFLLGSVSAAIADRARCTVEMIRR